jgi:predicted nucleic acid-binding protein
VIALDTNILLRSVLDDDEKLSPAARRIIERDLCHVSLLAIGEMGFVLMSVYRVKPSAVARACRNLAALPNIECENEARLLAAMDGVDAGIDWFDALLWAGAPVGVVLATFDKTFAKLAASLGWKVEARLPKSR